MSPPSSHLARFGVFDLDLRTGEIRKRGAAVRLQEQPFQVLAMLVERAGDLVTRDELRQRLWPDSVFVAVDQALNNAVAKIRVALGDSAESPRFVETLERRGYRFIAHVEWDDAQGEPGRDGASEPSRRGVAVVRLTLDDRTITLADGTHVIGRDPDAAVWIDAAVVSRSHARLVVRDGLVTLEDLGSRNGTFVNGARLDGIATLAHGDGVRVGTIPLVVHLSTGKTPTRAILDPLEPAGEAER